MKVINLLNSSIEKINKDNYEQEISKKNCFRAGSAGAYDKDNHKFYGSCPRKAVLRYLGYQSETDTQSYLNFVAGFGHEYNILTLLYNNPKVKTIYLYDKSSFVKEYEDKIKLKEALTLKISDDIIVSGRPDFEVEMEDGYRFAIETKSTVSRDKAVNSFSAPFLYGVCQAAVYKKILGMDYFIVYGNYSNYSSFSFKKITDKELGVEYKDFPKGTLEKVPCRLSTYGLSIEQETIKIIRESDDSIIDTGISFEMVIDYYIVLNEYMKIKEMPDRKVEIDLYGKPKYSECDYCENKEICDSYDSNLINYDRFLNEVQAKILNKKRSI